MEEMEPRLLFSADPAAPVVDALTSQADLEPGAAHQPEDAAADPGAEQAAAETTGPQELVLVDASISGYEQLVEDLRVREGADRQIEVLVLDPGQDPLNQISEVLTRYQGNLDALHVVSHGSEDALWLGETRLSAASLDSLRNQISGWGKALRADGGPAAVRLQPGRRGRGAGPALAAW
jgi:hypothetical protein